MELGGSMGPDKMHKQLLNELSDAVAEPLSILDIVSHAASKESWPANRGR